MQDTLANCAEWQSWTDAANATQAESRIFQEALPKPRNGDTYTLDELRTYRPFALIETEDEEMFRTERVGVGTTSDSGVIKLSIEDDVPEAIEDQPAEIAIRWRNHIGTLIGELMDQHGTAGRLAIESIEVQRIYRTEEEEIKTIGDAIAVEMRITWGVTES